MRLIQFQHKIKLDGKEIRGEKMWIREDNPSIKFYNSSLEWRKTGKWVKK